MELISCAVGSFDGGAAAVACEPPLSKTIMAKTGYRHFNAVFMPRSIY
jgi:hypothetical protein